MDVASCLCLTMQRQLATSTTGSRIDPLALVGVKLIHGLGTYLWQPVIALHLLLDNWGFVANRTLVPWTWIDFTDLAQLA